MVLRRSLVIVAVVIVASAGPGIEAAEAGTPFETYTWNIAGRARHDGGSNVVVVAESKRAAHTPLVMAFQEVCSYQYAVMKVLFYQRGYTSKFHIAKRYGGPNQDTDTKDGNCTYFGSAVFVLGTASGSQSIPFTVQYEPKPQYPEVRGMACRRAILYGSAYVGCTLHAHWDDGYAYLQTAQARNEMNTDYSGQRRLMLGDFNYPESAYRSTFYADYQEADDGDDEPTWKGLLKIDYAFANAGSYRRVSGNAVGAGSWSDHAHLYGTFALR